METDLKTSQLLFTTSTHNQVQLQVYTHLCTTYSSASSTDTSSTSTQIMLAIFDTICCIIFGKLLVYGIYALIVYQYRLKTFGNNLFPSTNSHVMQQYTGNKE